ncbi:hypothetical protein ABCW43_00045 [Neorhizobium sp. IRAMC:178]|uniref:hypothetical protein n=1 Tax=Neorhizobium tunisiense TaxID=3144793 RepID=UPI0031F60DDE
MNHMIASFDFIPNPVGTPLDDRTFQSSAMAQQREREIDGQYVLMVPLLLAVLALFLLVRRFGRR